MADAKPSDQKPDEASQSSKCRSQPDELQPDELEVLREETKRLRRLVVQLSKVAIRNAVNAK
jgi:hypothetical protein